MIYHIVLYTSILFFVLVCFVIGLRLYNYIQELEKRPESCPVCPTCPACPPPKIIREPCTPSPAQLMLSGDVPLYLSRSYSMEDHCTSNNSECHSTTDTDPDLLGYLYNGDLNTKDKSSFVPIYESFSASLGDYCLSDSATCGDEYTHSVLVGYALRENIDGMFEPLYISKHIYNNKTCTDTVQDCNRNTLFGSSRILGYIKPA